MKIIKPSVEFFGAVPTDYENALKFIEMAGRTCYKSEGKITPDSAEGFVKRLIKAGHLAMVEHSNFVVRLTDKALTRDLIVQDWSVSAVRSLAGKFLDVYSSGDNLYIGGNLTAWAQRCESYVQEQAFFRPFAIQYGGLFGIDVVDYAAFGEYTADWQVCPHDEIPEELHRYSAKFTCDRGVSHELVRHRPCSFAQESTRYVNYAGKDMEFIEPAGFEGWDSLDQSFFISALRHAESCYNSFIAGEFKPQQARAVLPNALKTEIVVTADAAEWMHIKKLRTSAAAHPDIQRVMNMIPWEAME